MIGAKLTAKNLNHILKQAKSHIGRGYATGRNILGNIDTAFKTFKDIYSIANPIIKDIAGETTTKQLDKFVMKGVSNYSDIRNKVMLTDEKAHQHYQNIVGGLKSKNYDIGL